MNRVEINVHIGEVKIAKNGEVLKTFLGSCVGIAFIWKSQRVCGLAHCLLAESPIKTFSIGGRFVDQAIPSLIALMKIKPDKFQDIEVILVGGGNMTHPGAKHPEDLVGSNNFATAERELRNRGFKITCRDQAAEEGRRITIDAETCEYVIETIPRIAHAA